MFSQTREFFFDLGEVARDSESDEAKAAGTGRWKLWVECAGFIMEKPVFGWCEDGMPIVIPKPDLCRTDRQMNIWNMRHSTESQEQPFILQRFFGLRQTACARSGSLHRRRLSVPGGGNGISYICLFWKYHQLCNHAFFGIAGICNGGFMKTFLFDK